MGDGSCLRIERASREAKAATSAMPSGVDEKGEEAIRSVHCKQVTSSSQLSVPQRLNLRRARLQIRLESTWGLGQRPVPRHDLPVVLDSRQLRVSYRACTQVSTHVRARAASKDAPETCTTFGTTLCLSTILNSVTAPHATLCCSLATRMIHTFVMGEKYLTSTHHPPTP